MRRNIDDLKKELVQEIKELAADIASSNSYIGLLANEIKFRSLQEKFINLKFLDRKHYGLEIFEPDPVIPEEDEVLNQIEEEQIDDSELEEIKLVVPEKNDELETQEEEPEEEIEESGVEVDFEVEEVTEEEIEDEELEDVVVVEEEIEEEEEQHIGIGGLFGGFELDDLIGEEEEPVDVKEEIEEVEEEVIEEPEEQKEAVVSENEYSDIKKEEKNYKPLQLDFNDKIAFQYQLFDGDEESMDMVIRTLNAINSVSDSKKYLADLTTEMEWVDKEEYVERLQELVLKRFE